MNSESLESFEALDPMRLKSNGRQMRPKNRWSIKRETEAPQDCDRSAIDAI
jgi:hypothetical protein